jgi:hypothetical protein
VRQQVAVIVTMGGEQRPWRPRRRPRPYRSSSRAAPIRSEWALLPACIVPAATSRV